MRSLKTVSLLATSLLMAACGTGVPADGARNQAGSPGAKAGEPRVVVAVLDSAVNPYHDFFHAGSPIYTDKSPSSVTPELLAELGIDEEHQLELTRTGILELDLAADAEMWANVFPQELYWFKGTNIMAISFRDDAAVLRPDPIKSSHGVGTTASVLTGNPEAVILFVEVGGSGNGLGSEATHRVGFLTPAVDIITTSYGAGIPFAPIGTGAFLPEVSNFEHSYTSVLNLGKLHFSSGGNQPGFTPGRAGAGPWWSIGVSGFEEGTSNGRTTTSGNFPDFIADFTQTLPYCHTCQSDYSSVGGTSFSTPLAAGVASRVLLEARRALGHSGGIREVDGVPVMVEGAGRTITNWEIRRALEEAAHIPTVTDYDPLEAVFDLGAQPINPAAPWLQTGWGELSADPAKGVVEGALAFLGLGSNVPAKAMGFCEFQTLIINERRIYWNMLAANSDSFMNAPENDPYIACDSALPLP